MKKFLFFSWISKFKLFLYGCVLSQSLTLYGELLAQAQLPIESTESSKEQDQPEPILINFNNTGIIEYIRFVSRLTGKNFLFDENDLQFNVTIVSEQPATLEDIMTALLQELRIHDLSLIEQGNNLIIHRNTAVKALSQVVSEDTPATHPPSEIVTQVFKLNTADPEKVASVVRPLTSDYAIIEVLPGTNHLIITDLSSNVQQIAKLIKSVDSPNSGLVVGQYVVKTTSTEALMEMALKIITPISQDQPFTMAPWGPSNSIFIVSTPYLVERIFSILQHLDQNEKTNRIFDLQELKYEEAAQRPLPPGGLYINGAVFNPERPDHQPRTGFEGTGRIFEDDEFDAARRAGRFFDGTQDPGRNGAFQNEIYQETRPAGIGRENQFAPEQSVWQGIEETQAPASQATSPSGKWLKTLDGEWILNIPHQQYRDYSTPPKGKWLIDTRGNWFFQPTSPLEEEPAPLTEPIAPEERARWELHLEESEQPQLSGPKGQWILTPTEGWNFQLDEGESFQVKKLLRMPQDTAIIPMGPRKTDQFYIYKLQYRKGATVQQALQAIADSWSTNQQFNEGLLATLASIQFLEASNSLIFTGTAENLIKMNELMAEVDTPLRQVFIEVLILETTYNDSLHYGVTWGTRFAGSNWAGAQGFRQTGLPITSPLNQALDSTSGTGAPGVGVLSTLPAILTGQDGFNIGAIGQKIINTATGVEFSSIGALVQAQRLKNDNNIVLNPKIITEDNVPAEIFVGQNLAYKTQSIANDEGSNITTNFTYRDVGTRLRVTPSLSNGDIISLEINQEISSPILTGTFAAGTTPNSPQGVDTNKSTTTTRVHMPSGYFLILSGMLRDQHSKNQLQVPCLGAIPILGAAFKDKFCSNQKNNQMIFVRPVIIETEEEIQNLTKHQQDIWKFKRQQKKDWIYETEEAYEFMNLQRSPNVDVNPEFETTSDMSWR